MSIKTAAILVFVTLLFFAPGRALASGQLYWASTNFIFNGGPFGAEANVMIVQPDGKWLAGGAAYPYNAPTAFGLGRFKPNGDYDGAFHTAYGVTFCLCNSGITALALQPDGKIVAAGYSIPVGGSTSIISLARYNADGSLDMSFGRRGKLLTGIEGRVTSAQVMPDGKIILGGSTLDQFSLIRFHSSGTLDATFGQGGIVRTPLLGGTGQIVKLVRQRDGKLVAGGSNNPGDGDRFAVARYNPDGSLDGAFGQGGFTTITFGAGASTAYGTALAPDGRIVAAGCTAGDTLAAIARLNTDGSLDNSFDGDGKVTTNISGNGPNDAGCASGGVTVQKNGKIVAAGHSRSGTPTVRIAVMRYYRNGTLDRSFEGDGLLLLGAGNNANLSSDLALLPSGNILVIGSISFNSDPTRADAMGYGIYGDHLDAIADFDADAATDLSIFRAGTSEWWYLPSGGGPGGDDIAVQFGTPGSTLVPADYTGDFKADIAEWIPATGEWRILDSENFQLISRFFGQPGDIPVPADYDGDGKADIAVFRPSNGYWYINNSSDGGYGIVHFGGADCVPVARDYDADGIADIAVFRRNEASGNGEWWVTRSAFPNGTQVMVFGASTDIPVPADYDGDGRTNVAVWRPSDGFWLILRWEDFSYYGGPFGSPTDLPVPGDYDGDGKADIAVFRPAEGNWYTQRSTEGFALLPFGVAGDKPIPGVYIP